MPLPKASHQRRLSDEGTALLESIRAIPDAGVARTMAARAAADRYADLLTRAAILSEVHGRASGGQARHQALSDPLLVELHTLADA